MSETLEQTAEKLFPTTTENDALNYQHVVMKSNWLKGAQIGVKWQQERSYNEEDMISLLEFNYKKETNGLGTLRKDYSQKIIKEWFEQFKK